MLQFQIQEELAGLFRGFNLNVDRLLLGLKHKINGEIYKSPENIIKDLTKIIDNEGERWRGYNYKSSNLDGDINADEPNKVKNYISYITNDLSPSKHFLNTYNKIVDLVKQKNANLIFTHPVTFRDDKYNLDTLLHQQKVDKFMLKMKEYGIQIECNPALFHLSKEFAFNTYYHPNKYGALIRSENLGYCINELVKNPNFSISYEEALKLTNKLEVKYDGLVKKSNYIKRFEDLNNLKIALEDYYKDNGKYPISQGFDGIYSKWGYSGNDWIKGLSPKYINKLPIDPRNTNNPSFQYLYKSNGKDYKLISHSPEDCKSVEKINKALIDPSRKCWAYGLWSDGAKDW